MQYVPRHLGASVSGGLAQKKKAEEISSPISKDPMTRDVRFRLGEARHTECFRKNLLFSFSSLHLPRIVLRASLYFGALLVRCRACDGPEAWVFLDSLLIMLAETD